jgi:hypothetical protein
MTQGPYVEVPTEMAFTIECSVRSAWEAIYVLLKRGPAPPPVYQGQYDPKALFNALTRCYYSDQWHSFLHPFLRSLLSPLAHALWDLASSRSPQFLEASATIGIWKSDVNRHALSPGVASRHRCLLLLVHASL